MKTFSKILLLALTLVLSVGALVACGDDSEVSYREVTEAEWKAAFKFDNATMVTTEKVYTDDKLSNQYTNNVYFVDGISYDANGANQGAVSAYEPYFAFVDCYGEFEFDPESNKYSAAKVTVKNIEFEKIIVAFGEDGKLALIEFSADNDGNDIRVTVNFSKFGETTIPEREAFVAEGKDYCTYKTSRDLEGKKLAYITIKIKNYGNVKLVLDASVAPKTVEHFLKFVSEGFYDGLTFCRVINDFMVQGGDPEKNGSGFYADDQGKEVTVEGEFSKNGYSKNDIKHLRGVISMARGEEYNSASCQFFICTEDADWLDGEYAAFGYVIEGMHLLERMTYDTSIFGDSNGVILNTMKQPVIEQITIDELVGIEL